MPAKWVAGTAIGEKDMLGVDFVDAEHGWAVGDITTEAGVILFSGDAGASWRPIATSTEVLSTVWFITARTGWAAGYAGRIQRTDDGGRSWITQRSEREGEVINSIFFVDAMRGWIVGGTGLVMRTIDGGATWTLIDAGREEDLWTVRFSGPDRGWIVGEGGLILASTDGGVTWAVQPSGTAKAITGLAVSKAGTLVAVGEEGTIARSDDGVSWQLVAAPTAESLNAVAAAGTATFRAVGSAGACISSQDGGKTWALDEPASSKTMYSVDTIDESRAAAVGRRGSNQRIQ